MKILLHSNALTKRGDSITLSGYAKALKKNYDIDCCLAYDINHINNSTEVIRRLKLESFKLYGYEKIIDLDKYAKNENIKTIYWLKSGENDGNFLFDCINCIHAVFNVVSPHGDKYAYVSEWLAKTAQNNYKSRSLNILRTTKKVFKNKFSENSIKDLYKCTFSNLLTPFDYVPHVVNLPEETINFREKYGISNSAFLIGRIGGYTEFNIDFVKETVKLILEDDKMNVFVFVNTEPFIQHDRVHFFNEYLDEPEKVSFIKACNMMLHARAMGETFGFAIAESLSMNIPIASCTIGHDKNHHVMLKNTGLLYNNSNELFNIYLKVKQGGFKFFNLKQLIDEFTPEKVAAKFFNTFLR
jgi:glycosyltransferase involved in cell wall biosynthesis